jgi:ABC-type multidrug transport system fused ATPase/permease subunit
MTNKELNQKITKSADIEWHKSVEETFNFSHISIIQSFKGVSAIYEYVNQQIQGWEKFDEALPDEFIESKKYFERIKSHIILFINNYSESQTNNLQNYWTTIRNEINAVQKKPIPYNTSQTEFLIKVYKETPNYFLGAYNFIVGANYNLNSRELLYGAILAYEFTLQDKNELVNRKKAEQRSISKLKTDFQEYLSKSEGELVEHLKNTNDKYDEYATQIDDLKTEKETKFEEWFENTKNEEWQKWYDEKIEKLQKLEETYETKLKLEKPAKYWQKKSTLYFQQGEKAKSILIWIVVITSLFLGLILTISPDWIFLHVFDGNSTAIIRWSLVFITLLTLIAFAIKAMTKYMFSSYHLARDAEERHTLTFFYLALLRDTEVKDDDRKLILQSLFSRVETGLLKDDSSPTMPNDIVSKFLNK